MNDKPAPLAFVFFQEISSGFGMKSALTERASEPWPKGAHPKEDGVEKRCGAPIKRKRGFCSEKNTGYIYRRGTDIDKVCLRKHPNTNW